MNEKRATGALAPEKALAPADRSAWKQAGSAWLVSLLWIATPSFSALVLSGCFGSSDSTDGSSASSKSSDVVRYKDPEAVYTIGVPIPENAPENVPDDLVSVEVSPDLPPGLSLDTATGILSGTPTQLMEATEYRVRVRTRSGAANVKVTVTIVDVPPSFSGFSTDPATLTVGIAHSGITLTGVSGGAITDCSVTPVLPAGLALSESCVISGTPLVPAFSASYLVTATNSGGASSQEIAIQVLDNPPVLAVASASVQLTRGVTPASSSLGVSNSGGGILDCTVNPALPAGLSLSSSCTLSGTPSALSSSTSYTITANNTGGSGSVNLSLSVVDVLPSIQFLGGSQIYTKGTAISALTPRSTGGAIDSCSITPVLPGGLTLSPQCRLSGNPSAVATGRDYTVIATNSLGSASTTVRVQVKDIAPILDYSGKTSFAFFTGSSSVTATPRTDIGGAITACSVAPALPAGLTLSDGCVITGTSSATVAEAPYVLTASNSGGSSSNTLRIRISEVVPAINYSPSNFMLRVGVALGTTNPSNTGGPVRSCSVDPALPNGLILGSNCAIAGTPSATSSTRNYVITPANNAGSGAAKTISIQVDFPPLAISFPNTILSFTQGAAVAAQTPTITGGSSGAITACSASPALPNGLSLSQTTCVLSGTPTIGQSQTTHTITATGQGGPATATLNITVPELPPAISYSPATVTLSPGQSFTRSVINTGGVISGCSSMPLPPAGITVGPDCTISGSSATPLNVGLLVTAANSGGTSSAAFSITVSEIAPDISYSGTPYVAIKNQAISPISVVNAGGPVSSCSITPVLPSGFSFNAANCQITGTPTAVHHPSTHVVTASNSGGVDSFAISMEVQDSVPVFGFPQSPLTLIQGVAINPSISPDSTGAPIVSCSDISGLPAGLSVDAQCRISGTPSAPQGPSPLVLEAVGQNGSSQTTLSIRVLDPPPALSLNPSSKSFVRNSAITAFGPVNGGGPIAACAISVNAPAGLTFNPATCEISGTPTALQAASAYRITATNPAGSSNLDITLEVLDSVPAFSYNPASVILTRGQAISAIVPGNTGGSITSCSINASLPAGLALGTDCRVTGTPSSNSAAVNYTITGTNASGQQSTTLEVRVVDPAPSIVYSPATLVLTKDSAVTPSSPVSSGGPIDSCSINGALPAGLSFSTANCQISGTPTSVATLQSYLVTATNSGGTAQTTLSIQVNDIAPDIDFPTTPVVLQLGQSVSISAPTNTGGAITSCSSATALPSGLVVNPSTCAITGTAMATQSPTDFTLNASNSGGNSSDAVNIEVRQAAPSIVYAPASRSLILNQAMTAFFPLNGGGASTSCSITPAAPAGITFNTLNCGFSGTPTAASAVTTYTVTATNAGGNSQTTVDLEVAEYPPVISYTPVSHVYSQGAVITPVTVTSTGGPIASCAINPALPSGLSINNACTLSGTANATQNATLHTITATGPGGTAQATLTLTVNEQAPIIVYSPSSRTLTRGASVAGISVQSLGGAVSQCTILPALPAGMNISSSCVVSGTPSVTSLQTAYTVTASNTGGQGTATLTLTVNEVAPVIAYASDVLTYQVGDTTTVPAPTNTGGTIASCSSSPAFPAGMILNNLTCAISGSATTEAATANYIITATNSGGSATETLSITVNTSAPSITYSPATRVLALNQAVTSFYPLNSGSASTSCSINPALPAGLNFNTTTCGINGTPTASSAAANYTVSATNSGGSNSTTLNLAVSDLPPVITYSPASRTLVKGSAASVSIASTGGPISSCAPSPALPAGLTLSGSCAISGTPSAVAAAASYTITATGPTGATGRTNITLAVNDVLPALSYAGNPFTQTIQVAIGGGGHAVTSTGGAITQCAIAPSLPAGLTFNSTSCLITGTPTVIAAQANYSVTATNSGGSANTTISLRVNDVAPGIDYPATPYVFTVGQAVNIPAPTRTGGAITGCQSGATLPSGMTLNATTCAITGTALAEAASTAYTITAGNSGGSGSDTVTIRVNLSAPSLSYSPSTRTLALNQAVTTLFPINGGGAPASCSISAALPAGLTFNTTNCGISGTPTVISASAPYTITATNSGGFNGATLNLAVADLPPVIQYNPNSAVLTKGTATTLNVVSSGGAFTTCGVNPGLPTGLTLNNSCTVTGTPSVVSSATSYTVTATGSGGAASANLVLTVNDIAPQISYSPATLAQTINTAVGGGGKAVSNTGGAITQCTVAPALPTGLSLGSNCTVTGTPIAVTPSATYAVTATNTGGSSTSNLSVEVRDIAPNITYGSAAYSFVQDIDITDVTPTNSGGGITQCSSNPLMPGGLTLLDDCTITGRPADAMTSTSFVITASNSGGSSARTISISVDVGVPNIYFTPASRILGVTLAAQSMIPANTGGAVTSCQVTGTVPAGLTVSSSCMVSGTPTTVGGPWTMFLLASNAKGVAEDTAELTITVNEIPPVITYAQTNFIFTKNTPISQILPVRTGGNLSVCTVSPALPAGLQINSGTCGITGTPSEYSTQQTYLIAASNSTGSSLENLTIRVNDIVPAVSYSPSSLSYLVGSAITAPVTSNSGGAIVGCSVNPALPNGMSLNSLCQLSGTPLSAVGSTPYTVTAVNSGGSSTASFTMTVQQQAPNIQYFPVSYTFSVGGLINTVVPFSTAGSISNCVSDVPLPAGLQLNATTCAISGTPTVASANAQFQITASNSTGSSSQTLTISVASGPPILTFNPNTLNLTANIAMSTVSPINSGGAATACNVDRTLPLGITLTQDCHLTGTPVAPSGATLYTITGANNAGIGSAQITITVADGPPILSFNVSNYIYIQNVPITPFSPTNIGGAISTCGTTPTLPAGLSISNNCVISGTPTQITAQANYAVQATNGAGSDSENITITVNPGAPVISFSSAYEIETLRSPIAAIQPVNTGGAITGCSVTPALPVGISFTQLCVISGTPLATSPRKTYTVTASNASGSSQATFDMIVRALPLVVFQSKMSTSGTDSGTKTNSWNIWRMSSDGADRFALTTAASTARDSYMPSFASTGEIFYSSRVAQAEPINFASTGRSTTELWSTMSDGSSMRWRTTAINSTSLVFMDPVFGEVGGVGKIAFASRASTTGNLASAVNRHLNIFMVNTDGTGVVPLTTNSGMGTNTRDNIEPTWAPDGSFIVFTSEANLSNAAQVCFSLHRVITASPYTRTILVNCNGVTGKNVADPSISPDGTKILYHSTLNVGATVSASNNIFVYNIGTGTSTALTTNTAATRDSIRARWSPDGTEIVFLSKMNIGATTASSYNVWKMSVNGSNQAALTANTAAAMDADRAYFSPDGQSIVFSSKQPLSGGTASIHYNIWTMSADGSNEIARTAATGGTGATKDSLLGRGNVWYVAQ